MYQTFRVMSLCVCFFSFLLAIMAGRVFTSFSSIAFTWLPSRLTSWRTCSGFLHSRARRQNLPGYEMMMLLEQTTDHVLGINHFFGDGRTNTLGVLQTKTLNQVQNHHSLTHAITVSRFALNLYAYLTSKAFICSKNSSSFIFVGN